MSRRLALGLDFGTESARALLVDVATGEEVATSVEPYRHGVIDSALPGSARPLGPDWALQHPGDYLEVLRSLAPQVLRVASARSDEVIGIGVDFTACTMLPVRHDGTPLCLLPEFQDQPHAWVKLWKHHAAAGEAERINEIAARRGERFLKRYGGRTSSEWMLAKAWQILNEAPAVYAAADLLVEAADWLVWQLTGRLVRSACCAGYKGLWSKEEGYPAREFLASLDERLTDLTETRLAGEVLPVGARAGNLTPAVASGLGLEPGTPVAVSIIDAHAAVPAAGITGPGPMLVIMGTSTCHLALGEETRLFEGYAGVVEDGILPGFAGYEAGQSATGDIYAWFVSSAVPGNYSTEANERGVGIHELLQEKARRLAVGESGIIALDWWNGNRSILMDASLTGLLVGLSLDSKAEEIYRALIEATAFGTRVILENFERNGVPVTTLVACGGLAEKNALLMQIHADVCGRPLRLVRSSQASALGAAIFGAAAAGSEHGGYDSVAEAARVMGGLKDLTYRPEPQAQKRYQELYGLYLELHDHFGRGGSTAMRRLKELKLRAVEVN